MEGSFEQMIPDPRFMITSLHDVADRLSDPDRQVVLDAVLVLQGQAARIRPLERILREASLSRSSRA
jgi:hypothetical protein